MITRRQSTLRNVEQLKEASFTATGGIDITRPITDRNAVIDTLNFDVGLDGALTLRKPLILESKAHTQNINGLDFYPKYSKHLYLEDWKILFYTKHEGFDIVPLIIKHKNGTLHTPKIFLVDNSSNEIEVTDVNQFINDNLDMSQASIVNTSTSTIIGGAVVDLSYFKNTDADLGIFINGNTKVFRYLHLTLNSDNNWVLKIMSQTPNEISSDTIRLNPNTALDYTYSIRDNYHSEIISVNNILPYVKEKGNVTTPTTVEDLTENGNSPGYKIATSVKGDEEDVYLKAFLNIKITPEITYVCTWEKTFDGVTWTEVPEFLEDTTDLVSLQVPSDTLDEELTSSSKYVLKTFKKFTASSQKDSISRRYDILKLNNIDGATYRFSIYTLPQIYTTEIVGIMYSSVNVEVLKIGTFDMLTYSNLRNNTLIEPVFTIKKPDTFNLKYTLKFNPSANTFGDFDASKFTIKFVYEDSEVDGTVETCEVVENKLVLEINLPSELQINPNEVLSTSQYALKVYYDNTHYFTLKNLVTIKSVGKDDLDQYTVETPVSLTYHNSFNKSESLPQISDLQELLYLEEYYKYAENGTIYSVIEDTQWYVRPHVNLKAYLEYILDLIRPEIPEGIDAANVDLNVYIRLYTLYNIYGFPTNGESETVERLIRLFDYHVARNPLHFKYSLVPNISLHTVPMLMTTPNWDAPAEDWIEYIRLTLNEPLPNKDSVTAFVSKIINAAEDIDLYAVNTEPYFFLKKEDLSFALIPYNGEDSFNPTYLKKLKESSAAYGINDWNDIFSINTISPDYITEDSISQITNFKLLGRGQYSFIRSALEFLKNDYGNTVQGKKLYYKKSIYSFGHETFKNNIFPTDVDSFNTPLFNVIDLDSSEDSLVTTLIPWRDYLIAATENSIYLISKQENGYYTKTINTFIGIPKEDSNTCKSILNGILFKSGSKLYILQPNVYAGDDTILNISEVSKPVANYILKTPYNSFAFSTEEGYYLFTPIDGFNTMCLKYEYTRKIWSKYQYPVHFVDYEMLDINDIRLKTLTGEEYYFNKTLEEVYPDLDTEILENIPYSDYISLTKSDFENYVNTADEFREKYTKPIKYMLDSGQKSDTVSYTKQFTETKIILATLHQKDKFPFTLTVKIDGKPQPISIGVHTDSALWKDDKSDINTLSTIFEDSDSNIFNVLRQMFVRYSAKGKSLQHIILGESYFNFKFYVVYYRYKLLNFKQ